MKVEAVPIALGVRSASPDFPSTWQDRILLSATLDIFIMVIEELGLLRLANVCLDVNVDKKAALAKVGERLQNHALPTFPTTEEEDLKLFAEGIFAARIISEQIGTPKFDWESELDKAFLLRAVKEYCPDQLSAEDWTVVNNLPL